MRRSFGVMLFAAAVAIVAVVLTWKPQRHALTLALPTASEVRAFQEKALKVTDNIRKTCDDLHLAFGKPIEKSPLFFRDDDHPAFDSKSYTGPSADFETDLFSFTFRRGDACLVSYQNRYLIDGLPTAKQYFDSPVKPQWTADKAIAIAEAFRKVMQDPSPAILGKARANYYSYPQLSTMGPEKTL